MQFWQIQTTSLAKRNKVNKFTQICSSILIPYIPFHYANSSLSYTHTHTHTHIFQIITNDNKHIQPKQDKQKKKDTTKQTQTRATAHWKLHIKFSPSLLHTHTHTYTHTRTVVFPDTHAASSPPTQRERKVRKGGSEGREGGEERRRVSEPEREGFEAAAHPFSLLPSTSECKREREAGGPTAQPLLSFLPSAHQQSLSPSLFR